ncbi:hypothetical protein SUGI_0006550 [Cryptomeria japonica]|uniref:rRNA biogenesis protein RRP5 n=1 Tax=Cryptomeria japonica TaxID=3369 RepID=UPI002408E803|nr:rRNA biogenesis protein RRP5 [Cryptomeria japonica]GLJ04920.1 hypothetical protein SUGI_0006550 [Cryptomeria japonica]
MVAQKKNLKRKNEDVKSLPAKVSMLPVPEEAPDFPRGGASVLSRAEVAEARAEVDAQFDTEEQKQSLSKKRRKSTKPSSNAYEREGELLFQIGITGKLPKFVNTLRYKNLSIGMKLWGVITDVNAKDLIVSLPGGLRGIVTTEEASDLLFESRGIAENNHQDVVRKKSLHGEKSKNGFDRLILADLFSVGQLVPCVVCKLEHEKDGTPERSKKKIWLSLRLSLLHKGLSIDSVQDEMVIMACVKSIEDHGYILSFGLPSLSGFLPRNKEGSNDSQLKKGQLVQGLISNIDRMRGVISLRNDPKLVENNMIKDYKGLSVDLFVPGMMVNARVQAILRNGLLLSFLTYFTGTVDIFHLQDPFPNSKWQEKFSENARLKARILYVDPTTKAVGLTLNPHLIQNKAPPMGVKVGEIFEDARVVRVDRGIGLLLELPSKPAATPAYVKIYEVSDDNIQKLDKKFKEGVKVRTRVMGFRFTEGIAAATLKASVLEQGVFNHSDVKPGLVVKAKIVKMEDFGAIVQLSNGLKALCPVQHMSEFEVAKPSKKFKVGAELRFRVLGCKLKRTTVTHKKTMVMSKLKVIAGYEDAVEGLITHGWITGIGQHGCFVTFYNGVSGLAHRTELGLDPGTEAESAFHVGQVVRCRVIRAFPKLRRLELSFIISSDRSCVGYDKTMDTKIGSIVSGVVKSLTTSAVILDVPTEKGSIKGTIFNEQLSDNPGHSEQIKALLKPGNMFDRLLVLDIVNQSLILSAKYSLIEFATLLPSDIVQIHPQSVLQGYICNIIKNGVFVRFLGRLTGFALKHQVLDRFSEDLMKHFYIGQSVRSQILKVNEETGKIGLSLKQSACFSTDASLIQGYFLEEDMISKLQASDSASSDISWAEYFVIGSCVEGEVQEIKEFGVIVNLKEYKDIVGFITHYQLGGVSIEIGNIIQARILDIVKSDGIVDLSLRPELLQHCKSRETKGKTLCKKRRKSEENVELRLHQKVDAVVELVKDDYLVLSLPKHDNNIAFASTHDFNMWVDPHKHYTTGQKINATVQSLPNASKSGRLLLLLSYLSDLRKKSNTDSHPKSDSLRDLSVVSDTKRARRSEELKVSTQNEPSIFPDSKQIGGESNYDIGSVVEVEVFEIKPLEMLLKFGKGLCGRIHITELDCENKEGSPFSQFTIGQKMMAHVIEGPQIFGKRSEYVWDFSLRTSAHTGNGVDAKPGNALASQNLNIGDTIIAFVEKIKKDWVWFVVSRHIRGRMFILDSSTEPSELCAFQKRFMAGKAIVCHISKVDKKSRILDLTLRKIPSCYERKHGVAINHGKSDCSTAVKKEKVVNDIHESDVLGGRIDKILPGVGGISVQIGAHIYGRVHFTELMDSYTENPLSGFKEGQFVKCKVMLVATTVDGKLQIDLSLRQSRIDSEAGEDRNTNKAELEYLGCSIDKISDLRESMEVKGYVKSISSKGCFVMLSRHLNARVLLSNLIATEYENLDEEFPPGKLVEGRILSVDHVSGRVEMTLKTKSVTGALEGDLSRQDIRVGDMILGVINHVEPFGIFVTIENSNIVGFCHASELSDNNIDNIQMSYSVGESVEAKVLQVDEKDNQIKLGMKDSYLENKAMDGILPYSVSVGEDGDGFENIDNSEIEENDGSSEESDKNEIEDVSIIDTFPAARELEARVSVPPLEVTFDTDINMSDVTNDNNKENLGNEPSELEGKDGTKLTKRAKKRLKEQRELEIRAAEQKRLEGDRAPDSVDEYEQLVRASPNNSFVWIKYMAFMLSLADVEKARAIAERALQTINFREEGEKLNVWVAYFNLENVYGSPPNEAVLKVFQRALQYCDPKKVHLALLGMYERTEQHEMADQLLKVMTRKFKTSSKVWLRNIQNLLKRGSDSTHMVLDSALLRLPRHKHIKFISQTAILEFKIGSAERARSLFEGVLRNYPKRTDLWSVYLDQEICRGDTSVIRALFERVICLDLPPKKMKFLFKKYLEYEKSQGDESRVEYVKSKAMEFVDNKLG